MGDGRRLPRYPTLHRFFKESSTLYLPDAVSAQAPLVTRGDSRQGRLQVFIFPFGRERSMEVSEFSTLGVPVYPGVEQDLL